MSIKITPLARCLIKWYNYIALKMYIGTLTSE
nr:MAG TPA: hypothetical protein [Caudoviricetes sp.]DAQ91565.1 MAG TPA: hypothetical protein [Caudoviricetes sp.]